MLNIDIKYLNPFQNKPNKVSLPNEVRLEDIELLKTFYNTKIKELKTQEPNGVIQWEFDQNAENYYKSKINNLKKLIKNFQNGGGFFNLFKN